MARIISDLTTRYKSLSVHVRRNFWWLFLLVIVSISCLFVGRAWAVEPAPVKVRAEPYDVYVRARPATTTTTTTTVPVVKRTVTSQPVVSGEWIEQCRIWAAEAGVTLDDAALAILQRESHCNPSAQNPSSSACGIAQNIRGCGSNGYGYDPISQLQWFEAYCVGRYGSFQGAWEFWQTHHWY